MLEIKSVSVDVIFVSRMVPGTTEKGIGTYFSTNVTILLPGNSGPADSA